MLAIIIILVIATVVVYVIRSVKPKRVRLRAGVLKILTFDFEADAGDQSDKDPEELPASATDRGASLRATGSDTGGA